jgi:hypothetical protein
VFAGKAGPAYSPRMRFRFRRGLIAVATAALFMLSGVGQNLVASGMAASGMVTSSMVSSGMAADAGMTMAVLTPDMASHNAGDCPPSDCSTQSDKPMACFAYCAVVFGILSAPTLVPISAIGSELTASGAHPLTNLHGPPEPHPPKPSILI